MKCPICKQEGYDYQHLLMHNYMDEWRKMKCELCGAKDEDFITHPYIHQCIICKKWECEFCIYHDGVHPHREEEK